MWCMFCASEIWFRFFFFVYCCIHDDQPLFHLYAGMPVRKSTSCTGSVWILKHIFPASFYLCVSERWYLFLLGVSLKTEVVTQKLKWRPVAAEATVRIICIVTCVVHGIINYVVRFWLLVATQFSDKFCEIYTFGSQFGRRWWLECFMLLNSWQHGIRSFGKPTFCVTFLLFWSVWSEMDLIDHELAWVAVYLLSPGTVKDLVLKICLVLLRFNLLLKMPDVC